MESVLVTGSEGCTGRYLVRSLHDQHRDLHVIRVARGAPHVRESGTNESIWLGDLTDRAFVSDLFRRNEIRYVIHAAGTRYSPVAAEKAPFSIVQNDLTILLHVLGESARLRRFVFLSSATVYESTAASLLSEETTKGSPSPVSPYGCGKQSAERIVEFFSSETNVPFTTWRLFNVVSPLESTATGSGHVFIDFFRQLYIERTPVLRIKGSGRQTRCFTWVEDVTSAIARALTDDRSDGQTLNLAHPMPHSLVDLANLLVEIGHKGGYLPHQYQPEITTGARFQVVDSPSRTPDVSRARERLNIECATRFEECFERFVIGKMGHDPQ